VVDVAHRAPDQVGDAAGRVAGPPALLEHDDLAVGLPAAHLHGGAHSGGVTTDDDKAIGHGARVRRLRPARRGQITRTFSTGTPVPGARASRPSQVSTLAPVVWATARYSES